MALLTRHLCVDLSKFCALLQLDVACCQATPALANHAFRYVFEAIDEAHQQSFLWFLLDHDVPRLLHSRLEVHIDKVSLIFDSDQGLFSRDVDARIILDNDGLFLLFNGDLDGGLLVFAHCTFVNVC